jgi:hypothetical protein
MTQRLIKVIKQNDVRLPASKDVGLVKIRAERDADLDTAAAVDQWIVERRANDVAERLFSDESILAWAKMPLIVEGD